MSAAIKVDLHVSVKRMTALEMYAAAPPSTDNVKTVAVITVIRSPWGYQTCWE